MQPVRLLSWVVGQDVCARQNIKIHLASRPRAWWFGRGTKGCTLVRQTRKTGLTDQNRGFDGVHIVVLGDVMLDAYVIGQVHRISPEAPVPVLKHSIGRDTAGGAANVALNITSLSGRASLIGLVGDDAEGRRLGAISEYGGVDCHLVVDRDRPTTTKTRVQSGRHQLVRIDREETGPLSEDVEKELLRVFAGCLEDADAVILSDYGKGCLTDYVLEKAIGLAKAAGLPVLVDPKRKDFSGYSGATYIKPNRSELALASGLACSSDGEARAAAQMAIKATGANILLTRSEQGMALYPAEGGELLLDTEAVEVFDVSGAGDTVIATFALAVATDLPAVQAMRLANVAASVVVSKAGTAVLTIEELNAEIAQRDHRPSEVKGQLASLDDAVRIRELWRSQGLSVGFTNGCFDLVHPGHIAILRGAASHCDRLIVALNTDASVSRLKGPTRPIQKQDARAEVMGAIDAVDLVVLFDDPTPLQAIQALIPDVLVKGADYEIADIVGADVVMAAGGRVERVGLRDGHSTSKLIARSVS